MNRAIHRGLVFAAGLALLGVSMSAAQVQRSTGGATRVNTSVLPAGPPPTSVTVTGTQAKARVTWVAPAGVAGFSIQRWLQSAPDCCRKHSGTLPAQWSAWDDDSGLFWSGTYVYRVIAHYSDGREGYADATFARPEPQNPAWVKAERVGADVVVSWAPVPNVSRFLIAGDTRAESAEVGGGQTSVRFTNVPAGPHRWSVGSRYDPGPVESSAATWPTVTYISGNYRVVLNGAQVYQATTDDMLERDGKGDEVYFGALVERFDRTRGPNGPFRVERNYVPRLTDPSQRTVYGDVNGYAQRIRAGTRSNLGGIQNGDIIPMAVNVQAPYAAPQYTSLPLLLWSGELVNGRDVLIVHPAVGEWDGSPGSGGFYSERCPPDLEYLQPATQEQLQAAGIGQAIVTPVGDNVPYCERPTEWELPPGGTGDRYIGLLGGFNDPGRHFNTDYYLVLTREKIEAALAGRSWATVPVQVADTFKGGDGSYVLWVLIERLP